MCTPESKQYTYKNSMLSFPKLKPDLYERVCPWSYMLLLVHVQMGPSFFLESWIWQPYTNYKPQYFTNIWSEETKCWRNFFAVTIWLRQFESLGWQKNKTLTLEPALKKTPCHMTKKNLSFLKLICKNCIW